MKSHLFGRVVIKEEDGVSFNPEDTLIRTEFATLISLIIKPRVDPTGPFRVFSDVVGHWAAESIHHAANS
ncbi:hypothetical protein GCM10009430_32680 [Aquimarina litoralis]|uniref:Uncharacterized protein n=1 Tax=Aquimarina litoralis TaxID=584605 RepID=A0ABN1J1S8_9FLAO